MTTVNQVHQQRSKDHKKSWRIAIWLIISNAMFLASFSACNKFLDKKSDNKLVSPSTLKDLQAILDDAQYMNNKSTPAYGETSADNYFVNDQIYNTMYIDQQHYYTWQYYDYNFSNDWAKGYIPIYNANLCIELLENIDKTKLNEMQWNYIMGASLFFRSYYMTCLLWNYSKAYDSAAANTDMGIVLRLQSDFNQHSVRSSVAECYAQVLKDAHDAAEYLPVSTSSLYRPSKIAAYGLLSRIYLSMRNYHKAKAYADSCLSWKNDLIDLNGDPDINGSIEGNVPFKLFNKETIFYTEMSTNMSLSTPTFGFVDTVVYNAFENNDLRKKAYFRQNGGYFKFKGTYTSSYYVYFTGLSVDEIYLTRAECNARNGNVDDACSDLNILRSKKISKLSFAPINIFNKDNLLDTILLERRKELLMRGLRWIDIKRLNKEGRNIVLHRRVNNVDYTLTPNSDFYALPLPSDILKLSGIVQN